MDNPLRGALFTAACVAEGWKYLKEFRMKKTLVLCG